MLVVFLVIIWGLRPPNYWIYYIGNWGLCPQITIENLQVFYLRLGKYCLTIGGFAPNLKVILLTLNGNLLVTIGGFAPNLKLNYTNFTS